MTKNIKFISAVAIQVIIILVIIIFKFSIVSAGTSVYLRILPVDPRDPLRGDYVTFQYDISQVSAYTSNNIRNGDTVYVTLNHNSYDSYWHESQVLKNKPTNGETFIKGKVVSGGYDEFNQNQQWQYSQELTIRYGIEEYFIPEGKGQGMSFFNSNATAYVIVDDDGNAVLKQIYVNEKPWP